MSGIVARFAHYMSSYENTSVPMQVFDEHSKEVFAKSVPLSSTGARVGQDFLPGTYLIRAILPSGEILADTVVVRKGDDAKVVLRPKHQSPREDLSWAYYLQKPAAFSRSAGYLPTAEKRNRRVGESRDYLPKIQFWSHGVAGWRTVSQNDPHIFRHVFFDAAPDLQIERPTMRIDVNFNNAGDWRTFPSQIWLQAGNLQGSQFIPLPLVRKLQVLIVGDGHRLPLHVQVSNGDATVESLLSFLESGDFDSARLVGSDWAARAEELLRGKVNDPIAATVAGYFLLRAGELARLHDWTENLANWFEWLPDGPVIRAWHLIAKPRREIKEIRRMFLEAVDRGLPYYSMGLRLLQSGLKLIGQRNSSDEEITQALQRIAPYLSAVDSEAVLTSFVAADPKFPGQDRDSIPTYRLGRNPQTGASYRIKVPSKQLLSDKDTTARLKQSRGGIVRNKADLAGRIASDCNFSKGTAMIVVDTALSTITAALQKGDRVALQGFGTFSLSQRKARNGRNPQTGATIKIAARKVAKFTPGAELKKAVNRK